MKEIKDVAIEAAKEAGKILQDNFYIKKEVSMKENEPGLEYLSNVDLEAEDKIVSIIKSNFPDHNILSEEKKYEKTNSDYTWIVDPLDGTSHYIRKIPLFSTSIAVKFKNEVVLGIVYNPVMNEFYFAEKNKGAFLNGERINVSDNDNLEKAMVSISTYMSFSIAGKEKVFMNLIRIIKELRNFGQRSLDLCYVSNGRVDGRILVNSKPWDHAAACLIIEEAGGKVTEWDGKPWSPESVNIVASNGKIHSDLLKLLR